MCVVAFCRIDSRFQYCKCPQIKLLSPCKKGGLHLCQVSSGAHRVSKFMVIVLWIICFIGCDSSAPKEQEKKTADKPLTNHTGETLHLYFAFDET